MLKARWWTRAAIYRSWHDMLFWILRGRAWSSVPGTMFGAVIGRWRDSPSPWWVGSGRLVIVLCQATCRCMVASFTMREWTPEIACRLKGDPQGTRYALGFALAVWVVEFFTCFSIRVSLIKTMSCVAIFSTGSLLNLSKCLVYLQILPCF